MKPKAVPVELGSLMVKGVTVVVVPVVTDSPVIVRVMLLFASVLVAAVKPSDFVAPATAPIAPNAESLVATVMPWSLELSEITSWPPTTDPVTLADKVPAVTAVAIALFRVARVSPDAAV